MQIDIYQINSDRDVNRLLFTSLSHIEKYQGSSDIDSKIYDKIFSGEVDDCKTLEDVYTLFNTKQVNNYYGHSLSVSDIVEVVDDNSQIDKGFYFCDTIGFKKVEFNPELTQDITKANEIKVILVQEGKLAQSISIENNLKSMQELVGGYIEVLNPFEDEVGIVCNSEGKIFGLPLNRAVFTDDNKEIVEIISGDFFIVYTPSESEKFESLPKDLEEKYLKKFLYPENFFRLNGNVKVVPYKPNNYYLKVSSSEAQMLKDNGIKYSGKVSPETTNIIKINSTDKTKAENLLNTVRQKNNNNLKK